MFEQTQYNYFTCLGRSLPVVDIDFTTTYFAQWRQRGNIAEMCFIEMQNSHHTIVHLHSFKVVVKITQ